MKTKRKFSKLSKYDRTEYICNKIESTCWIGLVIGMLITFVLMGLDVFNVLNF